MEISKTRRVRLKEWFSKRSIPEREKSYISQLLAGKAPFGERAARRLEHDYGMPQRWLDQQNKHEAQQDPTPHNTKDLVPGEINADLLEKIIEAVENRLAETKTKLTPKIKASAITMLYEHFSQTKAVDLATVQVLLKGIIKASKETSTATNNH